MSEPKPCNRCGRLMVFAEGPNGPIPLDAKAVTVYRIVVDDGGSTQRNGTAVKVEHDEPYYVSHFVSCLGLSNAERPAAAGRRRRR